MMAHIPLVGNGTIISVEQDADDERSALVTINVEMTDLPLGLVSAMDAWVGRDLEITAHVAEREDDDGP